MEFETEIFIIPLIVAAGFAVRYPLVISKEEVRLSTVHKDALNTYRGRVPEFIPSFSSYEKPDDYMIKSKMFRKRLFKQKKHSGVLFPLIGIEGYIAMRRYFILFFLIVIIFLTLSRIFKSALITLFGLG